MKKIVTERAPPSPLARKRLISLKLNAQELEVIESLAKKHADGNVSAWVRHAAMNYRPK